MDGHGPDPEATNTHAFETERLVIEVPGLDDVDPLFALVGGPDRDEICATLVWDGPDDRADTLWWVERCRTAPFAEWGFHWVIRDRTGQLAGTARQPLGAIGTRSAGVAGRVDVGYWLGRAYWGRGVMSEALAGLVRLLVDELDCVKIEAHVFAGNEGSQRVVERAGFEREGLVRRAHRKRGVWVDEVLFGLVV